LSLALRNRSLGLRDHLQGNARRATLVSAALIVLLACGGETSPSSNPVSTASGGGSGTGASSSTGGSSTGGSSGGGSATGGSATGGSSTGGSSSGGSATGGSGGTDAGAACYRDADCPTGMWCRPTQTASTACVPFATEGETCGGFTAPWDQRRCAPDLLCTDTPPFIADAPGRCRVPCSSEAQCPSDRYCASGNGVCRDDGACFDDLDCHEPGNSYAAPLCLGYGECRGGACVWTCGNEACRDVGDVSFGNCKKILGWAIVNGVCQPVSGCGDRGHAFSATAADCQATCGL